MTAEYINKKALEFLEEQEWGKAQKLLFYNAKSNPSHESYNNLGYYLITEGMLCKNGKTINALKKGMSYLHKALELDKSPINYCALVRGIEYWLQSGHKVEEKYLCDCACYFLKDALSIEYSDDIQYNFLRFLYISGERSQRLINQMKNLVEKNAFRENVSLYLEMLRTNLLLREGLYCIEKYGDFLDDYELLMFYARFGLFEKGYNYCKSVSDEYAVDEFVASAIIESYIATCHFDELDKYLLKIKDLEITSKCYGGEKKHNVFFDKLESSMHYRKDRIDNYHLYPPLLELCCYFGCPIHNSNPIKLSQKKSCKS